MTFPPPSGADEGYTLRNHRNLLAWEAARLRVYLRAEPTGPWLALAEAYEAAASELDKVGKAPRRREAPGGTSSPGTYNLRVVP